MTNEAGKTEHAGEAALKAAEQHQQHKLAELAPHHEAPGQEVSYSPFDMTYAAPHVFWLVLSFGILFIMLWKVILPRLASTLEERKDRIAADLDQAAHMKADAEAAEQAYETALADSRAKAHAIATETRAKLDAEVSSEVAAAEAEFAKRQQAAEVDIRAATEKALGAVESIASEAASDIISRLTGKKPTAAAISKAIKAAQG